MQIGLVGSGNMATALARGLGEPVLCTDALAAKAQELATLTGGEALTDNVELARRSDLIVLCHKPAQLEEVAAQIGGEAKAVVSLLAGVTLDQLAEAYPDTPLFRIMPNTAVAIARGVVCLAPPRAADQELTDSVIEALGRLGEVVELDENLIDPAMAIMGVGPAYVALIAEAWADSGARKGLSPEQAMHLVVATLAGSAALLKDYRHDAPAMRKAVTSPGGVTEKGIAALEQAGLREAFTDALEAVLSRS